jgi:hypothetical protein
MLLPDLKTVRRWAARALQPRTWALTAVTLISIYVVLEFSLRYLEGVSLVQFDNLIVRDLGRSVLGNVNRYDPVLGWSIREDAEWQEGQKRYTFGQYSLRMPTAERTPPAAAAILAAGDSFTAGSEVDNPDTWPAQLGGMLKTEVQNAGQGGFGADQIVLRTEQLTKLLAPRILVVSFLDQDVLRTAYRVFGAPKPYFDMSDDALVPRNVPVPQGQDQTRDLTVWRQFLGRSYLAYKASLVFGFYPWFIQKENDFIRAHSNEEAARISCLLVQRLASLRQTAHTNIIFMMQYGGAAGLDAAPSWFGRDVVECARKAELTVIDTHPVLHAYSQRGVAEYQRLFVMHDGVYGHMSAAGNELIAGLVRNAINSLGDQARASP